MKKIFTLIAATLMAVGAQAESLIDFSQNQTRGITFGSTNVTLDAVKLKTNTVSTPGIKFASSYTTESKSNGNNAELSVDGGFKAGDKIIIAGAYNNTETKLSAIDIFTLDGTTPTVLFTTQQFINGRTGNDNPVEETFTLTADVEKLYLGRNGATATFITTLKVVRGEESILKPEGNLVIDYPAYKYGISFGSTNVTFDVVKLKTNTVGTSGIKFASSYTTESKSNGNNAELSVDGGFKAGDKIIIAGAYNNTETKLSAIDIFTLDGTTPTVLFTTQQFINGRTGNDNPVEETFTLTADVEKLYLGRNGATATFVTTLKVERLTTGITDVKVVEPSTVKDDAIYNLSGQKVNKNYKGVVIKNGVKTIQK